MYLDLTNEHQKDWITINDDGKYSVDLRVFKNRENLFSVPASPKEGLFINPKVARVQTMDEVIKGIPFDWIDKNEKIYGKLSNVSLRDPVSNLHWDYLEFIDSSVFAPAATAFNKSKRAVRGTSMKPQYTHHIKGTFGYKEFWDEELRRIKLGYEPLIDGVPCGIRISGEFYFYLNYTLMDKVVVREDGRVDNLKEFPNFLALDYYWFKELEARENPQFHGFDPTYKRSISCVKTRRAGFSYKEVAGCVWIAAFENNAKVAIASAPNAKEETDAVHAARKCSAIIDHLSNYTPYGVQEMHPEKNGGWKNETNIDRDDQYTFTFGYFNTRNDEKKGRQSQITTIGLGKDDALAGKALRRLYIEEAGRVQNVDAAWAIGRETMKAGALYRGIAVIFGCLPAGELVMDKYGKWVPIETITYDTGIVGYDYKQASQMEIVNINPPAKKECFKITTNTGIELRASFDHPILATTRFSNYADRVVTGLKTRKVLEVKKRLSFKEMKDLKVGDLIAVVNETPFFGIEKMWHPRLVGLLVGDGSYGGTKTPVLSNCDSEIWDYVDANFDSVIEKEYTTKDGKSYQERRLLGITTNLAQLGIRGQSRDLKTLPKDFHKYTKECMSEFFGGLFDADGYVRLDPTTKKPSIIFTSAYVNLVQEVKRELVRFGIHGSIQEIKANFNSDKRIKDVNNYFRLVIADNQSVVNFQKNITFLIKEKQRRLDSIYEHSLGCKSSTKGVFSERVKGVKGKNKLTDLSGFRLQKIKSIEPIGEHDIYNLTVDGTNTYLANTVITHNTGSQMVSRSGKKGTTVALSQMHYNPGSYELAEFNNIYEYESSHDKCGFFVSTFWCYFGAQLFIEGKKYDAIDNQGNANFWVAELYLNKELKDKAPPKGNLEDYNKTITQKPKTAAEAFLITQGSVFQSADLIGLQTKTKMEKGGFSALRTAGELIRHGNEVKFVPDLDGKLSPITSLNEDIKNKNGCLLVYEIPKKLKNQQKSPEDAYIISIDPIGTDNSAGDSFISIVVLKNPLYYEEFGPKPIVATYCGRNKDRPMTFARELLYNLQRYYNAKVTFENDRDGGILMDCQHKGQLDILLSKPTSVLAKGLKTHNSKTTLREFGHSMGTEHHKSIGENLTYEWLGKYAVNRSLANEEGEIVVERLRNLDLLEDEFLIEQLIAYKRGGNYDTVLALFGAIIQLEAHYSTEPDIKKEVSRATTQMHDYYSRKLKPNTPDEYERRLKNKLGRIGL